MITVLIVEDEIDTRRGIRKYINWQEIGVDIVEEADNGLSALDLCESIHPNILLTDVRMPKMDGIQLATYIHEKYPDCKIIFLSGYSDKEYLKSAIRLGAISYVEKPLDISELTMVLSQAVNQHLDDIKKQEKNDLLESMYTENLPVIIQKLAVEAAYKSQTAEFADHFYRVYTELYGKEIIICSIILKLPGVTSLMAEEQEHYKLDILRSLQHNAAREIGFLSLLSGFIDDNKLIVHCIFNEYELDEAIKAKILILQSRILGITKSPFSTVVGVIVKLISDISISSQSALKSLSKLFFLPKGEVLFNDDRGNSFVFKETEYEVFQGLIQGDNSELVLYYIDALASSISYCKDTDTGYLKNIYFKLFTILSNTAEKRNIKINMLESEGGYIWQEISKMDTIFDITAYLRSLVLAYFSVIENKTGAQHSISDIIKYIDEHYSDTNLSIKSIAEYAHYDHYYLCTLFKKNTGKTLNDHITEIRIEKAKEFLKDTHIKQYDITAMVGYSDPSYFSKIFKKMVGHTPSEFREKFFI